MKAGPGGTAAAPTAAASTVAPAAAASAAAPTAPTAVPLPGADRPLRADARRNRARVLEAAGEAFAAEGPSVPLDEIARRAGVGAGTVYRHFPTKEALLHAVLTDRLVLLHEKALAALDAPDPGPAFFTYFDTMVAAADGKMDLAEALAGQGIDVIAATRDVAVPLKAAMEELLRRAQDAGAVRADVGIEILHALVVAAVSASRAVPPRDAARVTGLVADALRPGREA